MSRLFPGSWFTVIISVGRLFVKIDSLLVSYAADSCSLSLCYLLPPLLIDLAVLCSSISVQVARRPELETQWWRSRCCLIAPLGTVWAVACICIHGNIKKITVNISKLTSHCCFMSQARFYFIFIIPVFC